MARACQANGCALLGGETAEMPGFYQPGEYDLAGFIVGAVERVRLIDGKAIRPGDVVIGLASSGLHTNGYSLARRIAFDHLGLEVSSQVDALGTTVGDALLRPHRTYLPVVRPLLATGLVKGMAHITGGGITDNLPRIFPDGVGAEIDRRAWTVPPLFRWLVEAGGVPDGDAWRTFNMGLGLLVVVAEPDVPAALSTLQQAREMDARVVGRIVAGDGTVRYLG
jgi:phosphoribosylformylglycinamidine cyclo-ligase